jgi:acyl-CoA reductase-like NAD-dependent aldehyde dehydrogenase
VEVLQDGPEGRVELHRKPVGVVAAITPWNWPVMIACWQIIPAIRTGNTVVIKPSPFTPLSTIRLVELINEVLPPGVVNVVTCENDIGSVLTSHPDIAKVTFTGSTATGRKVMASAADTLKRLTLELGGNDAGIVLPDADPKAIAEGLFWGAFINNGQTCACLKRLYVHETLYEDVCDALAGYAANIKIGDGMAEDSMLGPVQNRMQYDIVSSFVRDAVERGGRVLTGGAPVDGPGYFYPITLVADIDHGAKLVDLEQFGPALPIIRYSDLDDVIAKANDNPAGLGGSVWSADIDMAKAVASRLECGSVWINRHGAIQPNAPFGGVKQSGVGIEFGVDGLKEFTTVQTVFC